MLTYDESYLGRIFCPYVLMKTIFHDLKFSNDFMGGLWVFGLNKVSYATLLRYTFNNF